MLAGGIVSDRHRHFVCTSLCFHLQRIEISFFTIASISWFMYVCLPAIVVSLSEMEFSSHLIHFWVQVFQN